jgi:hypothetical protein
LRESIQQLAEGLVPSVRKKRETTGQGRLIPNAQIHAIDPRRLQEHTIHNLVSDWSTKSDPSLEKKIIDTLTQDKQYRFTLDATKVYDPVWRDLKQMDQDVFPLQAHAVTLLDAQLRNDYKPLTIRYQQIKDQFVDWKRRQQRDFRSVTRKLIREWSRPLFYAEARRQDVFFLSRLFHSFPHRNPSHVQNAIFFGGDRHAEALVSWLEKHGFQELKTGLPINPKCTCIKLNPGVERIIASKLIVLPKVLDPIITIPPHTLTDRPHQSALSTLSPLSTLSTLPTLSTFSPLLTLPRIRRVPFFFEECF